MRRVLAAVVAVAVAALAATVDDPGRRRALPGAGRLDPSEAARRAHREHAGRPLSVRVLDPAGAEVAWADGGRAGVGSAETAAPLDPAALLAPLLRPARWDGATLVLHGQPPATATVAGGRLALVVELGGGHRLVVTS